MPSRLLADLYVAVCPEGAMRLADSSCDNASGLPGLVHQGTLDQVTGPPPVHRGDRLHTYCWEWESVHGPRDRNGNYCRHNEHL